MVVEVIARVVANKVMAISHEFMSRESGALVGNLSGKMPCPNIHAKAAITTIAISIAIR